jgi:hypothetical protein
MKKEAVIAALFIFCLMTTLTVNAAWAVDVPAQINTAGEEEGES